MGFTIGHFSDGAHLAAVCEGCGVAVKAERDPGTMQCIVPDGWQRIGEPHKIATIYTVPVYRSTLLCARCLLLQRTRFEVMESELTLIRGLQDESDTNGY